MRHDLWWPHSAAALPCSKIRGSQQEFQVWDLGNRFPLWNAVLILSKLQHDFVIRDRYAKKYNYLKMLPSTTSVDHSRNALSEVVHISMCMIAHNYTYNIMIDYRMKYQEFSDCVPP